MGRLGVWSNKPNDDNVPPCATIPWRFVLRVVACGVIGLLLIATAWFVIGIYMMHLAHQRERGFMRRLEDCGGRATYQVVGPTWIPMEIRGRYTAFLHINYVDLEGTQPTLHFLPELKTLPWLRSLDLGRLPVEDADLTQVEQMTGLESLGLRQTRVTDAGLTSLRGLTSLTSLRLEETQTTPEGRNQLRGQLPNCQITPEP